MNQSNFYIYETMWEIVGYVVCFDRDENIVAKELIAHDEQFLLMPQCFQKSSAIKKDVVLKVLNSKK